MKDASEKSCGTNLQADEAVEFASWFRCLADATRLRVLNAVACADRPVTVGEVVAVVGVGQSTVSHHLQKLCTERFIFRSQQGTRTLLTINRKCLAELPEAAMKIMGVSAP